MLTLRKLTGWFLYMSYSPGELKDSIMRQDGFAEMVADIGVYFPRRYRRTYVIAYCKVMACIELNRRTMH